MLHAPRAEGKNFLQSSCGGNCFKGTEATRLRALRYFEIGGFRSWAAGRLSRRFLLPCFWSEYLTSHLEYLGWLWQVIPRGKGMDKRG